MQLGANYSPALIRLLRAGEVDIDRIKVTVNPHAAEHMEIARALRPILLHGLAARVPLGHPDFEAVLGRERFGELVRASRTPYLSGHIAGFGHAVGETETLERLAAGAHDLMARFGLPVHLESLPHRPNGPRPRFLVEPEFLHRLVEASGCRILIDLAHCRCSAYQLGLEDEAYFEQLPLAAVHELHVNSPSFVPGEGWRDRHLHLSEYDYGLIRWLLERAPIEIVTLEYGIDAPPDQPELARVPNDPERLKEQIDRLRGLLGQ